MENDIQQGILLIDAGNSAVKWAIKMGSESNLILKESLNIPGESKFDSDPIFAIFTEQWKALDKPSKVIASCVAADSVWRALLNACDELWNIKAEKVTSLKQGFGLINAYENPADLGSDRWCAMIAANQLADSAFIVVDAGSALTIDMVNESGQHLGGYITPGLNMMRHSLHLRTAQVKTEKIYNSEPSLSLANSTTACVEAGIHLSVVKLIEAVYEQESKKVKNLQCYLTGGNATLIAGLLSFKCVIIPDLVLRGLAQFTKDSQE